MACMDDTCMQGRTAFRSQDDVGDEARRPRAFVVDIIIRPGDGGKGGMDANVMRPRNCARHLSPASCARLPLARAPEHVSELEISECEHCMIFSLKITLHREQSKSVDILFAPYNYLIDPGIRHSLTGIPWDNAVLIFDEAHNLENICADVASFDLLSNNLTSCFAEAQECIQLCSVKRSIENSSDKQFDPENYAILKALLMALEKKISQVGGSGDNVEIVSPQAEAEKQWMQISVKISLVGKTIKLNVKKSNSAVDVKAEIERKVGILMNKQILLYTGRQLEDNQMISQCELRNGPTLHVLVCPTDKLCVFVNVRGERIISLDVNCCYTVAEFLWPGVVVKHCKEGAESSAFWFSFGGKQSYTNKNATQDTMVREPHLYAFSVRNGGLEVNEIFNFSKDELLTEDMMILDTHGEVFIWIGQCGKSKEELKAFDIDQSKDKAEMNQAIGHSENENSCHLCKVEKLTFEPPPIYCSPCGARIRRDTSYYTARLEKKRNDEETEEWWVQCDKCECWQHQVCALLNGRRNEGGPAEYTCPNCYVHEVKHGLRKPLSQSAVLGAKDLPRTVISDHIENRLFKQLKQERQDRANQQQKSIDEILGVEGLVVRVVSSVDKKLEVKPRYLEILQEDNYPTEFPYKSKAVLLFQEIEGVEVCLFGMYIQEFGAECSFPNQSRVYLSYLDYVKYFKPEIRTVSREALRTYVYHEILTDYLDYCKQYGFTSCFIWVCPPLKSEDYILYCQPEIQKTPKSDKLREWSCRRYDQPMRQLQPYQISAFRLSGSFNRSICRLMKLLGRMQILLKELYQSFILRPLIPGFLIKTLEDKWVAEGKEMSELEISECEHCMIFSLKITLHWDSLVSTEG